MSASLKLSLRLQDIAQSLDDVLRDVAGERIGFVLVLNADGVAQYISNASRKVSNGIDFIDMKSRYVDGDR